MNLHSIFNYSVILFLFSLPFVSAFSLSSAFTLPLMFAGVTFFIGFFLNRLKLNVSINLLFLVFLSVILFSASLNMSHFISNTPLNHIISFIFCFALYFTIPYSYLSGNSHSNYNSLCKIILIGVVISAIVAISEFVIINFFKIPFDYFPRPAITEYEPLSIGGMVRARGFAEESGHFALYLISMYMCVFAYVKYHFSRSTVFIFTFLVGLALLCSFSVSGIVFCVLSIFSTYALYNVRRPLKFIYAVFTILSLVLILDFSLQYYTGFSIIYDVVYAKLSGSTSMSDRLNKLESAMDFLSQNSGTLNYLFGIGPAFYETYSLPTIVTLYPLLYVQFGIIGLISFLSIAFYPVFVLLIKGNKIDKYLFCSYFYSMLFFAGISNYWFPWFWVILAMMLIQSNIKGSDNIPCRQYPILFR